jgi:uncharacterized membrane protein YciS (DUF1049 family)
VIVIGVLAVLAPAGAAALLGWENRNVVVRVHAGPYLWTGHLYAVLVVGALAACWLLLGLSCIRCRMAELRATRERKRRAGTDADYVRRLDVAGKAATR